MLNCLPSGPIPDTSEIEGVLADCWTAFVGNNENGMEASKLYSRMESVNWQPPILLFNLERHGGTVRGSTRAEMQHWQIDLDRMTAKCPTVGHRQVRPMAKAVRQKELEKRAEEIAVLIQNGAIDSQLRWKDAKTVNVVIEQIIPTNSGFKQTVQGRRKRFRQALEKVLAKSGWEHIGINAFRRSEVKSTPKAITK